MRKCPKCNKTYDDTWGICLNCNEKLVVLDSSTPILESIEKKKPKIELDDKTKKELILARSRLKRDMKIEALTFIAIFVFAGLSSIFNKFVFLAVLCVLAFLTWRIFVVFRIRYVLTYVGKNRGEITLYQLLALFIPFGEVVGGAMAIEESNKIFE